MPSKKKARTSDGFGNTIDSPTLDFIADYIAWETKCKGISDKDIQSEGRKTKEGKKSVPNTLFGQLEQHVTSAYRRPNSSNRGDKGVFEVLKDIAKTIKGKKILTKENLEDLEKIQDKLAIFEQAGSKLNPRNILFHTPTSFDKVKRGGKTVVIASDDEEPIYGHYVDDYFVAKYPEKNYEVKDGWHSKTKNKANPPLAQALFGSGDGGGLGIQKGLIDIVDSAIEELKKEGIDLYTIGVKRASALALMGGIRKWVNNNIKNPRFYPENSGKINLTEIANALRAETFTVVNEKEQKLLILAATDKKIDFAQDVKEYRIGKISSQVMGTLIKEVIARGRQENIKVRNGYYLRLRGLSDPPSDTWKDIKKSWQDILRW